MVETPVALSGVYDSTPIKYQATALLTIAFENPFNVVPEVTAAGALYLVGYNTNVGNGNFKVLEVIKSGFTAEITQNYTPNADTFARVTWTAVAPITE